MIELQNVSIGYGGQGVLHDAGFRINPGEHIGIVGPNGAGKTTIFRLITGELQPDRGSVTIPTGSRIGCVRQQLEPHREPGSLLQYVETAAEDLIAIEDEIDALQRDLGAEDSARRKARLTRLGELQTRYEAAGGYDLRHRAEQALAGLGFPESDFARPFRDFSGGWQSRAELARMIVANPDILLLDEPSNYLDNPTIEWLQKFLREFEGTLLLISHDRFLLNSLTTSTLEVANARVERYAGSYERYWEERRLRVEQRRAAQRNQDRKRAQTERFIERFRSKNTKASQVQSRIKQLEKMESVDVPAEVVSKGRIRLRPPPHSGAEVLRLDDVGISYDGERWVLRGVSLQIMRGDKVAFVGYNGFGKTTLLRCLSGRLEPTEGARVTGHKVRVGYQSQDFAETMEPGRTVFDTVRASAEEMTDQGVRTHLGGFGFRGDEIEKTVNVLSGGEKVRLALARLLATPPNVLILDEPTTHLDVHAREALQDALAAFEGTICLVSHDIEFIRGVAQSVVAMTPPGVTQYAGDYDYYREKALEEETGGSPEPIDRKPAPSGASRSRKDQRRERAQARQELHARKRELKKTIRRAEASIERFEAEQAALTEQLSTPDRVDDFEEMNRRLTTIRDELTRSTRLWEDASLELEAMNQGE